MAEMADVNFEYGDHMICPRCSLTIMLEEDGLWWDIDYGTELCLPLPNGEVMRHAPHAPR